MKKILLLTLILYAAFANAQEKFDYTQPYRIFPSDGETMVYSPKYSARCYAHVAGKLDKDKRNFTEFELFVAYSYNPWPGTSQRCDYNGEKVFRTTMPVDGKKTFKFLAIDNSRDKSAPKGEPEHNFLKKEGKYLAVLVEAKINGRKYDETDRRKAVKFKFKIVLVDRDKVQQ